MLHHHAHPELLVFWCYVADRLLPHSGIVRQEETTSRRPSVERGPCRTCEGAKSDSMDRTVHPKKCVFQGVNTHHSSARRKVSSTFSNSRRLLCISSSRGLPCTTPQYVYDILLNLCISIPQGTTHFRGQLPMICASASAPPT